MGCLEHKASLCNNKLQTPLIDSKMVHCTQINKRNLAYKQTQTEITWSPQQTEKTYDKSQHPFMITALRKHRPEWTHRSTIQPVPNIPKDSRIPGGVKHKSCFSLRSRIRHGCHLSTFIQNAAWGLWARRQEKEVKKWERKTSNYTHLQRIWCCT